MGPGEMCVHPGPQCTGFLPSQKGVLCRAEGGLGNSLSDSALTISHCVPGTAQDTGVSDRQGSCPRGAHWYMGKQTVNKYLCH